MKKLTCHCGEVEAEVNLPEKLENIILNDGENHPLDQKK